MILNYNFFKSLDFLIKIYKWVTMEYKRVYDQKCVCLLHNYENLCYLLHNYFSHLSIIFA
jgi:hypothetical protein